jgi:Uma2 family endonuclease
MTLLDHPRVTVVRRTPVRWTKAEYNDAVERGWLRKRNVYLYRGELIEMPAMGTLHIRGISRLTPWLVQTFDPACVIRSQGPFELPDESMPQPEFVICTPEQAARRPHPNAAVLIIEVADSAVELDQELADHYAAAGVPDYWIVSVRDRLIEVYRSPAPDPASPTGHRYGDRRVYADGESVAPLARPVAPVAVATFVDVG